MADPDQGRRVGRGDGAARAPDREAGACQQRRGDPAPQTDVQSARTDLARPRPARHDRRGWRRGAVQPGPPADRRARRRAQAGRALRRPRPGSRSPDRRRRRRRWRPRPGSRRGSPPRSGRARLPHLPAGRRAAQGRGGPTCRRPRRARRLPHRPRRRRPRTRAWRATWAEPARPDPTSPDRVPRGGAAGPPGGERAPPSRAIGPRRRAGSRPPARPHSGGRRRSRASATGRGARIRRPNARARPARSTPAPRDGRRPARPGSRSAARPGRRRSRRPRSPATGRRRSGGPRHRRGGRPRPWRSWSPGGGPADPRRANRPRAATRSGPARTRRPARGGASGRPRARRPRPSPAPSGR